MAQGSDSVRIVLFDADEPRTFLVLTEVDDPDNWKLPGGKFDTEDETPDEAAARELAEELGLMVSDLHLQKVAQLLNNDGVSARYIYSAAISRSIVRPSVEIALTQWVTTKTIPAGPNSSHILSAVQAAR